MLVREAVKLDWRLLWHSLQQSSGGIWMVLAALMVAAATMGESSVRLGESLASGQLPRTEAAFVISTRAWAAFMAAFAFVLTTGELSFVRRLLADLALRPVSRWQAFLALQAVSLAGRHTLALLTVGLPLLIVMGTWLDGRRLAAAVVATLLLMRLPVALLTIGARVLSSSITMATASVSAILLIAATFWFQAPGLLLAWLPPFLLVRLLLDGSAVVVWAGLATWTLALAAVEFWSMKLDEARATLQSQAVQSYPPIPRSVQRVAQMLGCSAVLLHGELVRLSRWRRFYLSWLMGLLLMAIFGIRLHDSGDLVRLVLFTLVPAHVGTSTLANLFATDRGGFQAFLMAPIQIGAVVRAKVTAILLVTMVAELAGAAFLAARGLPLASIAAGVALAAGLFAWSTAVGMMTSVLFPSPSDPAAVGGSLVNTSAALVTLVSGAAYVGAAIGLVFLLDSGRSPAWACALAGVTLIAAAASALVAASRRVTHLITLRTEAMVFALTANPGARA